MTIERRPVTALRGVGPSLAKRLGKLGIETVADLLFWLPTRYEDRTHVVPIGSLRPGMRAAVQGTIELAEVVFRGRRSLLVRLSDGTGFLTLRFFHFSGAQQQQLMRGARLTCFGEVRRGKHGPEIVHPEYRDAGAPDTQAVKDALTPIYPVTEGLQQGRLRNLTAQALAAAGIGELPDFLPVEVLQGLGLPSLHEALQYVHRPPPDAQLAVLEAGRHPAQRRLAFEELLAHQLTLRSCATSSAATPPGLSPRAARSRSACSRAPASRSRARSAASLRKCAATSRRRTRCCASCRATSARARPSSPRSPRADVVEAGGQAALMAPTELLAEQHAQNFTRWLAPLGLAPLLITGRHAREGAARGGGALAGGDAGLRDRHARAVPGRGRASRSSRWSIVDEQHRFGVHQRMRLREKGAAGRYPHQLVMTATPIPRTLAMTAYADLDVSVIDELPPGRMPVATVAMPDSRRDEVVRASAAPASRAGRPTGSAR